MFLVVNFVVIVACSVDIYTCKCIMLKARQTESVKETGDGVVAEWWVKGEIRYNWLGNKKGREELGRKEEKNIEAYRAFITLTISIIQQF